MTDYTCPYCDSDKGYYHYRSIKQAEHYSFAGVWDHSAEIEEQYRHEKMYCRNCNIHINSFIKHVHREMDNG